MFSAMYTTTFQQSTLPACQSKTVRKTVFVVLVLYTFSFEVKNNQTCLCSSTKMQNLIKISFRFLDVHPRIKSSNNLTFIVNLILGDFSLINGQLKESCRDKSNYIDYIR